MCDCQFCEHNKDKRCDCQPCEWIRERWPDLKERHAREDN